MKRITALAVVAALAGCVPPPLARPDDPVAQQCEYEAEIAIQSIQNPLYAGVRKAELMGMCMRAKGR